MISRSGSLRAATSDYPHTKLPVGKDLLSRCVGQSPWAVGSPAEHVAHREEGTFFIQLFHGQQRTVHLSLTQPLSEMQGAALGLNPFKSFLASNARHPCLSHAPAWDAASHAPPKQLSVVRTLGQGTCLLLQLFPDLPSSPKDPFLPWAPASTL